jgi:hypothetical protein
MKIGQPFNKLTFKEYYFYIDNHKKYTDFNTLGLYRSIIENDKLTLEEKIELREYAHKLFHKTFDFLQLKDPKTYLEVSTLGEQLTEADKQSLRKIINKNQQRILADKRIKHRNFGMYSKHNCVESCPYNGLMVHKDSSLAEDHMHFKSDTHWISQQKSSTLRKETKSRRKIDLKKLDNL